MARGGTSITPPLPIYLASMRVFFLLLFLKVKLLLIAQSPLEISGHVLDAEEEPLVGAYVYPKSNPASVVITEDSGRFALRLPAPDTIMVSFLGFEEHRQFVDTAGSLSITLRPNASASMDALVVRARRIPYGELASQQIGQMDIYLNPAAKADPLLAVNTLPAATNMDETANVSFRGSPSSATGIYLNDVPIRSAVRLDQSNGVGQFSIFGQIPLRDVRIYPSHPPVSFSQSSAGAVGLYTSEKLPTSTQHGLTLSMAGLGVAYSRPLGEKSGVRAFLNYGNLSAFRLANQSGLPALKRSRSLDAAVQFVHQLTPQSSVQLFYLGFQESYRFATRTPYYQGDFEQEKPRHLTVLNWRISKEQWTWSFNQSVDWEKPSFRLGNIQTTPRRLTGHLAANGRYEGQGVSFHGGTAVNVYDDRTVGTFPLTDYGIRPEDPNQAYATETRSQLLEAFAYGQFRLGDEWTLGIGLKPIIPLDGATWRYTAQASLRYCPTERHRFILGGGHFSQYLAPGPAFREWQWLSLAQLALAYEYRRDDWVLSAALFAKQEAYALAPDLWVRGGELRFDYTADGWTARLSGSVARSTSRAAKVPTDRDLPFLARLQLQRQFSGQWTFGLFATWRRGRYFRPVIGRAPIPSRENWYTPLLSEPAAGQRYPNFRRIDVSASKGIPLGDVQLILFINVNNVLDAKNVRSYTYDAAYLERLTEVYSRRLVFFGGVFRW